MAKTRREVVDNLMNKAFEERGNMMRVVSIIDDLLDMVEALEKELATTEKANNQMVKIYGEPEVEFDSAPKHDPFKWKPLPNGQYAP